MNSLQQNTKECYKSILNETLRLSKISELVNNTTYIQNKQPMLLEINNMILDNLKRMKTAQMQYNDYNTLLENFVVSNPDLVGKEFSDWDPKFENIAKLYEDIYINIIKSLVKD